MMIDKQTGEVLGVLFRGNVDALREVERLQRSHARYQYLRRLSPRGFAQLWTANLNGEGAFDELVDRGIDEEKRK